MNYTIWVSEACNLKCKYCYEGPDKRNSLMDKNRAEDVLTYIKNDYSSKKEIFKNKLNITFHGGEPFLNTEIIKYIISEMNKFKEKENLDLSYSVTTNCTILNKEILSLMKDEITDVSISIDGRKETQDVMRPFSNGKGSFDVVINNARNILKDVSNIRVRMTFNSKSVYSLAEDVIFLLKEGFEMIVPAADLFDKNWSEKEVQALEEQIKIIKEYIKDDKNTLISLCDPIDYCDKGSCTGGIASQVIYTDGVIYPCLMSGGVNEFSIGDIYQGVNKDKLTQILEYNNVENTSCEGCMMAKACDATRCKIINKLTTGDYNMPPVMECEIMNILYHLNGVANNI